MSKKFWFYFNTAVASAASAVTLFCAFAPNDWFGQHTWCKAILALAFLAIICWLYGLAQTGEKSNISLKISPNLKLNIQKGDLFKQRDIVVIPVNEYFDTRVDDVIIARRTIHGKFIEKYFRGNEDGLYQAIEQALRGTAFDRNEQRVHPGGRVKKYPIGTCADIEVDGTTFVLFALTHFDEQDKAYLPREEFAETIKKLMDHLSQIANNRPVYMPLIGTGLARLNQTHQRILLYIIDTIDFSCPVAINAGLNIMIYEGDMDKVNLGKIEEFYNETFNNIEL